MKLEDISDMSIGVLTSRELYDVGQYEYKIFNIKNYDEHQEYETVRTVRNLANKLTQKGDLLIKLIYPNRVICIDEKTEKLLVPSQMCIIRPYKKIINPHFLKWYLESDTAQEKISLDINGSIIPKISVAALRKIEIPLISLEKQNTIADLINLWSQEKEIIQNIVKQKEELYNNLITKIINEG